MEEKVPRMRKTMAKLAKEGASTQKEANKLDPCSGGIKELGNLC